MFAMLAENLNAEIAVQQRAGEERDRKVAELRGKTYASVALEQLETSNMHVGTKPSLLDAPIDEYPNIAVMAWQSMPNTVAQTDQLAGYTDTVAIEGMVRSPRGDKADREEMHRNEEIVNARCQRTMDAVVNVIQRDSTLGGRFIGLKYPPRSVISEVFVRLEDNTSGDAWLWQGFRIEFSFDRYGEY